MFKKKKKTDKPVKGESIVIRGVPGGTITSIGLQRTPVEWSEEDKKLFGKK